MKTVQVWQPKVTDIVPKTAGSPQVIATYAKQLSERERTQVIQAFEHGSFEMGSVFLWTRAMANLKKQLASLGAEFIGEMLDRPDIRAGAPLSNMVTDHEALGLAEQLGMFGARDALRLRQAMELVIHFADPHDEDGEPEGMFLVDAMQVATACVQSVLGHDRIEGAVEFARFRSELETRTLSASENLVQQLLTAAYFFQRTTLRVLVAKVKTLDGALLEHVMGNLELIVPLLWPNLQQPEKWLVGRSYAEVHAAGQRSAAASIRRALMSVKGFDFVPEDLRSQSFLRAAGRVKDAHFGMNNFYNEPEPMKALASMGSTIPMPAFPTVMSAVLCVKLGNPYGVAHHAVPYADELLAGLTDERWRYYLNDCLLGDDAILPKFESLKIVSRWIQLVKAHGLFTTDVTRPEVSRLLAQSREEDTLAVQATARLLYMKLRNVMPTR